VDDGLRESFEGQLVQINLKSLGLKAILWVEDSAGGLHETEVYLTDYEHEKCFRISLHTERYLEVLG